MESNASPDFLRAATDERRRLEVLLQADPIFQKFEAVCRVVELYEKEVSVRRPASAAPQKSGPEPEPIRNVARQEQNRHVDPQTLAASTKETSPGDWEWGRQSAQIRESSVEYLRQRGEAATGPEICAAIMKLGVEIRGKKPSAVVAA